MTPPSQPLEFTISPNLSAALCRFFHSQLFITPPTPIHSFTHQTIIITGATTGLGLEAARHFYRLNCARLILAVRTVPKGQSAKEDIVRSVKTRSDPASIDVWPLDLSSTASTIAFADRVKSELSRVDVLVENAGINTGIFALVEGYERTVQVNVLNTCLLALLLLPKLEETKKMKKMKKKKKIVLDSRPHLVVVSSEAHRLTSFPEINAPDIYARMNEREVFGQQRRYQATKLIEILFIRELVTRLNQNTKTETATPTPPVIINLVNPGLCSTALGTDGKTSPLLVRLIRRFIDRTTEVGARTFVLAASAPASSHGELQSDGVNQNVESWIYEDVGRRAQEKVFEQTIGILEERSPGIAWGVTR
ncbi:NAD(P)-binding protein [Aspergillus sclerotioniger CBS 115572]|uniref:NAD(P)-binding protein n=1 Tax=Aspergillus sclerotioniger CBS 115572 TaxID=1450535 RepID=A0A317WKJ9_9EURO|nr:NAD(P)-binding protein [Aspergillus sclerotioniger CBS 115572]PWY85812.1 NAD(P)-binding protein [Aspergillus sclerotioniger CBS 115572]